MLQWKECLETGDARIDAEHRVIFARLNEIGVAIESGAGPESLTKLIELLVDYSYLHFHHEENVMACSQCSMLGANCAAHRSFIERLRGWLVIINSGTASSALLSEIHAESCKWIESHIVRIDTGLRQQSPVAVSGTSV